VKLFHRHNWEIVGGEVIEDVSYGRPGPLRTRVKLFCPDCEKRSTEILRGRWTLAELRGEASEGRG